MLRAIGKCSFAFAITLFLFNSLPTEAQEPVKNVKEKGNVTAPAESSTTGQLQYYLDRLVLTKPCPSEENTPADTEERKKRIPPEAQQLLEAWLQFSKERRYTYYIFSVGIILFGALASALRDGAQWWNKFKTAAALLATLFGGLNSTLAPYSEHKKFDQAFVVLNSVKLAYLTNPSISVCEVGKAIAYGESLIHKGD
jgi:hypothetical protein